MIANKLPSVINWAIIPDASIHDNHMDMDPWMCQWEDVTEEDLGAEGQDEMPGQRAVRHARM